MCRHPSSFNEMDNNQAQNSLPWRREGDRILDIREDNGEPRVSRPAAGQRPVFKLLATSACMGRSGFNAMPWLPGVGTNFMPLCARYAYGIVPYVFGGSANAVRAMNPIYRGVRCAKKTACFELRPISFMFLFMLLMCLFDGWASFPLKLSPVKPGSI